MNPVNSYYYATTNTFSLFVQMPSASTGWGNSNSVVLGTGNGFTGVYTQMNQNGYRRADVTYALTAIGNWNRLDYSNPAASPSAIAMAASSIYSVTVLVSFFFLVKA